MTFMFRTFVFACWLGAFPGALHAQQPPAEHQHAAPPNDGASPPAQAAPLPSFIPPVTDADRQAAFPDDLHGHAVHDRSINTFVLFDQLEWQSGGDSGAFSWDTKGWVGQDRDRFWFRTEGDRAAGRTEQAQVHLLYGRAIARWWDVTAGVRLDAVPDTPRTALAIGLQGLAPYWFEVEASAYVEPSGRTHLRVETEYDLLVTNRLVLQPLVEFEIYGRPDRERLIGTGLSTGEVGLRLRYEVRREFAPYVGVVWARRFFGSADLARDAGEEVAGARLAIGLRAWF
jgi:copper resistance protein B